MTTTPSSLPTACSLTPDAAGDRQTDWQALFSRALIRRTSIHDGVRIELQDGAGVASELGRLVAAERECCPFMKLSVDTTDQRLVLTAIASESAAPSLEQMLTGGG